MAQNSRLESQILQQLSQIIDPDLGQDIVTLNFIKDLKISDNQDVSLSIELTTPACPVKDQFKAEAESLIKQLPGVNLVTITMTSQTKNKTIHTDIESLKNVKAILAVSSCKGGVGKSTVSVNLAYTLASFGAKVGLFDADVYGPSLPIMVDFPFNGLEVTSENMIIPPVYKGVTLMSFGYTHPDSDAPAMMRGPMVSQVIHQLLAQTEWGELDYLVIDMPPGTGDIQLTLGQILPITASVVVTTPQHVSFVDVVKGIELFDTLNIPTIAAVQNMSGFVCDSCDTLHHVFGQGAKARLQNEFGFPYVAEIPIHSDLSHLADKGMPITLTHPSHPISKKFKELATSVIRELSKLQFGKSKPPLVGYDQEVGIILEFQDNIRTHLPSKSLRLKCQCAYCVEEFTGKSLLSETTLPNEIYPLSINPVGNYALGINWSDGHSSLYPYTQLTQELA